LFALCKEESPAYDEKACDLINDYSTPAILNYQEREWKSTCLIWACLRGRLLVVKLLLQKGADPNLKNKGGYTALYYARGECEAEVKAHTK